MIVEPPDVELEPLPLPGGIRSRFVANGNGLIMHILEAGFETPDRPALLLLHGFPELAYSWRKIMPPLAAAGYHVIAPDQRGYGRTTGWDNDYDGDLHSFRTLNLARDVLGLTLALGYTSAAIVGHDFGAVVAAFCALARPDFFDRLVLMSTPFDGPPSFAFDATNGPKEQDGALDIHKALAELARPRKHNQQYFSSRGANTDMLNCEQGVHDFLRAYFHVKSADWKGNQPYPLSHYSAEELAKLPEYYFMDLQKDMPATVAPHMPSQATMEACYWLPEGELAVYSGEYKRTGFQGALQWFRCRTSKVNDLELGLFSGRTIDIPSCFVSGRGDWGIYQVPGAFEKMQSGTFARMKHIHLVDNAGHWVQQEQPKAVTDIVLRFLTSVENIELGLHTSL